MSKRMHRSQLLALKFAVVATTTTLALLFCELGARVVENRAKANKIKYLTAYDSQLGWSKTPNAVVENATAEFQVVERTNSKGLRGPEVAYDKPASSLRVLMLGDSFLEGYTVNDDDLVSAEVRRRLAERLNRPVEVINAGTVGYATDQELLFYELEGRKYRPDLTVLLFYVNDVWFNSQTHYWRGQKPRFRLQGGRLELTNSPVPKPDPEQFAFEVRGGRGVTFFVRQGDAWLGVRSGLYRLARAALVNHALLRGRLIAAGLAEMPGEWMPWRKQATPELNAAWRLTEALLSKLRDEVEADGSEFAVFYVPSRPGVDPADWSSTQRAFGMDDSEWDPAQDAITLSEICERNAIARIPSLEKFRGATQQPLYFEQDAHWTRWGHRLAGQLTADYLLTRIEQARPQ